MKFMALILMSIFIVACASKNPQSIYFPVDPEQSRKSTKTNIKIVTPTTPASEETKSTNPTAKWNGLVFEIIKAKMEGGDLSVDFKISSPGKERAFSMVNGGNAFVLINGDQIKHSHLQIGTSSGYSLYAGITIPGDLSVNSVVKFKSVPASLEKIDMLRFHFWNEKISFRNVSVN